MTLNKTITQLNDAVARLRNAILAKGISIDVNAGITAIAKAVEDSGSTEGGSTTGVIQIVVSGTDVDTVDFTCTLTGSNVANGQSVVMQGSRTAKTIVVLPGTYVPTVAVAGYTATLSSDSLSVSAGQTVTLTIALEAS